MVKLNEKFDKMVEVSQKYYVHGTTDIEQAIEVVLNPPEDIWDESYHEAVRAILGESKRRVHNSYIAKEKKEILDHTKVGDLLTPGSKWGADRVTVCAFYELANEGYLKLTKVRSKERDANVCGRYGYHKAYSYRVVYERIN